MIGLVAALWLLILYPVSLGPLLATFAIIAVMVGALTPDLDQPTANLFRRVLGGKLVHRLFTTFSGGHRHFTHALIGIVAIGAFLRWLIFRYIQPDFYPPALALWYAFMIGYISHPIADTLTDHGVPWLWPLPWSIKLPPGPDVLRVTTGSFVETILLRGGLIVTAILLLSAHWPVFTSLFQ